jgi:hypothetical protein
MQQCFSRVSQRLKKCFGKRKFDKPSETPLDPPIISYYASDLVFFCQDGQFDNVKKSLPYLHKSLNENDFLVCLRTSFRVAVSNGFTNIVEYLIDAAREFDPTNNIVNILLKDGVKKACSRNSYNMVETLLQRGASPDQALRCRNSPNIQNLIFNYKYAK